MMNITTILLRLFRPFIYLSISLRSTLSIVVGYITSPLVITVTSALALFIISHLYWSSGNESTGTDNNHDDSNISNNNNRRSLIGIPVLLEKFMKSQAKGDIIVIKTNNHVDKDGEPCQWINAVIRWFYLQGPEVNQLIQVWIDSLNLELEKFNQVSLFLAPIR